MPASEGNSEVQMTVWQFALIAVAVVGVFGSSIAWMAMWPIPRGNQNSDQAAAFLKQQFPKRELSYHNSWLDSTAPVAVVFHLIRHGKPGDAKKAIDFAAGQEFGYASPYVIERLESDDPELRRAARNFLRRIASEDYGPNAAPWKAWWRDPPRSLLGIATVGYNTFQIGVPLVSFLGGALLFLIGLMMRWDFVSGYGGLLMVLGCFVGFGVTSSELVGSFDVCTFGETEITYHQGHGIVEGLEDAKVGGMGLGLLLVAAYCGVGFTLIVVFAKFDERWSKRASRQSDPADAR